MHSRPAASLLLFSRTHAQELFGKNSSGGTSANSDSGSDSGDRSRAAGHQHLKAPPVPSPEQRASPKHSAGRQSSTGSPLIEARAVLDLEELVEDLRESKQESERRRLTQEKELARLRTMVDQVPSARTRAHRSAAGA